MDTLNHATQGFLMGYIPTQSVIVGIACAGLGACPDLIGEYKARKDNYEWYANIHNWKHWLAYLPPVTLHIALDKLGHGKDNRWYAGKWYEYFFKWKESMWLEVITWIINIVLLIMIFR